MALALQNLLSVAGKHVLVTGGARGVGLMISRGFVENGAHVYVSSRSAAACKRAATRLSRGAGEEVVPGVQRGTCTALPEDLSTEAGCLRLRDRLVERLGGDAGRPPTLDVLVNNSGVAWGAPLEEYPDEAWDKQFALNVKTPFALTRACLPLLDAASGPQEPSRVINVGSIAGITGQPIPTYAYDASKAALHLLTRRLAAEFAQRPGGGSITVNAVAPGLVPSRMSAGVFSYDGQDEETVERNTPLGRFGRAEDMAGVCLYLAGGPSSWITGTIIPVDGGVTCQPAVYGDSAAAAAAAL